MSASRISLISELHQAQKSGNYRQLQQTLKNTRKYYPTNVKLNSKKEVLTLEAQRLRDLIMNEIRTENEQRVKDEQEQSRQWDEKNRQRQQRYEEYKRNRSKHQYGWSESERRMYEEWQQRRNQQQPSAAEAPHQKFLNIFNQKLGQSYTKADLKKVYKELAKTYHPDLGGKTADFQALQKAYEIMS